MRTKGANDMKAAATTTRSMKIMISPLVSKVKVIPLAHTSLAIATSAGALGMPAFAKGYEARAKRGGRRGGEKGEGDEDER